MFTGLVETMGTVQNVVVEDAGVRLVVRDAMVAEGLPLGASVAVNGACLTVVRVEGDRFDFQAGPETLRLTSLGNLKPGDRVNLERSLRVGDRLGGHIVQGHVDGMGHVARRQRQGEWEMVWFDCEAALTRQMIRKGSITVDGVSLTLVDVNPDGFSVALIPHTMEVTTLGFRQPGDAVNLEIDMFAKYVFKCMEQMALPRG